MTAFRILRWGPDELPPVVCLHDVRGHARRFERLARTLEPGRLVVAYDLRGHGRSPWSGPHTIAQHAEDLDEVLDACGIEQAGLIGDSFGARVAIEYASRNQERINSLTLLDPPLSPRSAAMHAAAGAERRGGGYRRASTRRSSSAAATTGSSTRHGPAGGGDGRAPGRRRGRPVPLPLQPRGGRRRRWSYGRAGARLADVLCPTMLIRADGSSWLSATPSVERADRRAAAGAGRDRPGRPRRAVGRAGRDERATSASSWSRSARPRRVPGMRALVLQHIACEPPGVVRGRDGRPRRRHRPHRAGRGRAAARTGATSTLIVAMGGPMSVNDEADHPWLAAEKRLIGEAVRAGAGFWGACLGVQLLAASLGARVYAGPEPEVGGAGGDAHRRGAGRSGASADCPASCRRCSGTATPSTCPTAPSVWPGRRPIPTRPSASAAPPTASSFTWR